MRSFLLLVALFGLCSAFKDSMIQSNRIPVEVEGNLKTSCDECQSLVHRFHEAVQDPNKLAELKTLLRVLCHETSYVDECRVFVNNLDAIIAKLEPYIKDAKAVCAKLHLCSNVKLDAFHKIGMLYAKRYQDKTQGYKDLVCDECQFAATELKQLIDDKKYQTDVRDFIRNKICARLGSYQGSCDLLLEEFLPEFFQELEALLQNPKETCQQIGFCPRNGFGTTRMTGFVGFLSRL